MRLVFSFVLLAALPATAVASSSEQENRAHWTSLERSLGTDEATSGRTIRLLIDIGRGAIPILVEHLNSQVSFEGSTGLLNRTGTFVIDEPGVRRDCTRDSCYRSTMVGEAAAYLIRWILGGRQHAGTPQITLEPPGDRPSDEVQNQLCDVMEFLDALQAELSVLDAELLSTEHFDRILLSHGASFSEKPSEVPPGGDLFSCSSD